MANIQPSVAGWSTTEASNQPDGADTLTVAADMRAILAGVRYDSATRASISAGSTVDMSTSSAGIIEITNAAGSNTITSFGTVSAGIKKFIVFNVSGGSVAITHNATSMILPAAGGSITVADKDCALIESLGSGNWKMHYYSRYSGQALVASTAIGNEGRLTLATGTPVTTTDQTAKTTVYWTPYVGKNIALYSGSSWVTFSQAELSVSVPANTSTPFDVFMDYNSGTPALVATAWTNDTTRATALTTQDGVLVKSGTTTQRYLGTGRTTTVSGQTEDSDANRLLWNYYNRVSRRNRAAFSADRSTSSATYVELNSEIQCKFIIGVEEEIAILTAAGTSYNAGTNRNRTAFGIDSTSSGTAPVLQYMASEYMGNAIVHSQTFTAGYHYVTLLGNTTAGTGSWMGTTVDNGRWYLNVVMMR